MTLTSDSVSSGSLVERICAMDKQGWDQFVDVYGPLIHRWCLQCGLENADAADIVQDVFAKVIKSIGRFRKSSKGSFRGWLWMITRNGVRDFFRDAPGQIVQSGGTDLQMRLAQVVDPIDVFDEETNEDPTNANQSAELIRRALLIIESDFEPKTWQAFWKSVVLGEKTCDVASELSMSSNNVRQAKSRVLRRLREQLGEN